MSSDGGVFVVPITGIKSETSEKEFQKGMAVLEAMDKSIFVRTTKKEPGTEKKTYTYTYHCSECQRAYQRKNHLTTHMKKHMPDYKPISLYPYKCELCDCKYKHKANLRRHIRAGHQKS